mgnify:FL=1
MRLKYKLKKLFKEVIGDFSDVQWRNIDHTKVYIALALLAALLIVMVTLIVGVVKGRDEKLSDKQEPHVSEEQVGDETVAKEPEEEAEEADPLEVDAYTAINVLVTDYFTGLSNGDLALVESTVDVLTDEEKLTIERKKDYIEAYHNITCYTKKGPEEGSYVVFASYDMKIYNIETAAPGIMALYVCTAEDGRFYIFNGEASEKLTNFVLALAEDEEVAAVIADVDARYQELIAQDEDLGKFAETMLQSQQQETTEEEPEAPAEGDAKELETPVETTVNDGVRMRSERSTEAGIITTLAADTPVKVYASYDDGWSKIEYDGMTGYCKTEFLASTEGVPTLSVTTEAEEPQEEITQTETPAEPETETEEPAEENTAQETTSTEVNKRMQLKEAVKIRADRSTDSERLTNAYTNEFVEVLENYSDGWSKVDYNGTVGYCKTEFLKDPE